MRQDSGDGWAGTETTVIPMGEYEIHRPSFSDTTRNDWEFPSEMDFDTENLPAAADRFPLSASGFDEPDAFEDLALPVVTSRGSFSYNVLRSCVD